MAKVEFAVDRPLPAACVVCGNPATSVVPHSFPYDDAREVGAQLIGYIILCMIVSTRKPLSAYRAKTRLELNVPFCGRHTNYFGRGKKQALALGGIAALPWAVWGGLSVYFTRFSFDIEYALMAFVALAVVWLIVVLYSEFASLRVSKRTAKEFVLHNVSRAFVEKCKRAGIS